MVNVFHEKSPTWILIQYKLEYVRRRGFSYRAYAFDVQNKVQSALRLNLFFRQLKV